MPQKILVTGATGKVAALTIDKLLEKRLSVRALVHDAKKAGPLEKKGVEIAVGDYDDKGSLAKAFAGVDAAFLVTPPHPEAWRLASNLIAAARASSTMPYCVRLSVVGASVEGPTDNVRQHGRTERELQDSGLDWVMLRPHFFMQNFLGSLAQIKDGALYYGFGEGKLGLIDTRDIADCAAAALTDRSWSRGTYELTGPASIDLHEVTRALSEAVGRAVKYVAVPPEAVEKSFRDMGLGDWFATVMRDYSKAYAANWGNYTTALVQKLAGHAPRSIADFAREVVKPALAL
jgi:NAD(P)H dehydrogenase (quinone)